MSESSTCDFWFSGEQRKGLTCQCHSLHSTTDIKLCFMTWRGHMTFASWFHMFHDWNSVQKQMLAQSKLQPEWMISKHDMIIMTTMSLIAWIPWAFQFCAYSTSVTICVGVTPPKTGKTAKTVESFGAGAHHQPHFSKSLTKHRHFTSESLT